MSAIIPKTIEKALGRGITMSRNKHISGYTLIELMVSVAIIGILAGIAVPVYNSYISLSASSAGTENVATLRLFQENYRLEMDTYLAGTHTAGAASSVLTTNLNWDPDDNDKYTYTVTPGTTGNIATSLTITATCDLCENPIVDGN